MQTSDQEQEAHHNSVEKSLQQGADQDNNHISEAEKLWQMAKELGVSCKNGQENQVQQLLHMEERDITETQRLGGRKKGQ